MTTAVRNILFAKATKAHTNLTIDGKVYRLLEDARLQYDGRRIDPDYYEAYAVDGDYNIYLITWDIEDHSTDDASYACTWVFPASCELWKSAEEIDDEYDIPEIM